MDAFNNFYQYILLLLLEENDKTEERGVSHNFESVLHKMKTDSRYKSIYQKLVMTGLLSKHIEALEAGTLKSIDSSFNSEDVKNKLIDLVMVLKGELFKEIIVKFGIPELKSNVSDINERKSQLLESIKNSPVSNLMIWDSNRKGLVNVLTVINSEELTDDKLDELAERMLILKHDEIVENVHDFYKQYIISSALDVSKRAEILETLDKLLTDYSEKYDKSLVKSIKKWAEIELNDSTTPLSDQEKARLAGFKNKYSMCIPAFDQLFTYYKSIIDAKRAGDAIVRASRHATAEAPKIRIQTYGDDFFVNDLTGEVVNVRNISKYNIQSRIKLLANCLEGYSWRDAEAIKKLAQEIIDSKIAELSKQPTGAFAKFKKLPTVAEMLSKEQDIKSEVESSYDEFYGTEKDIAGNITTETRKGLRQIITNGEPIPYSHDPVTIEELKFVHDNFEFKLVGKTPELDSFGNPIIRDKITKEPVISPRTILTFQFACLWFKEYKSHAFDSEHIEEYNNAARLANTMVNIPNTEIDFDLMDSGFKTKPSPFFSNIKSKNDAYHKSVISAFYQMQTQGGISPTHTNIITRSR